MSRSRTASVHALSTGLPSESCFFFQAEDGIRELVRSRGVGDVYKRQAAGKRVVVVADTAHASIDNALHILGLQSLVVPTLSLIHI